MKRAMNQIIHKVKAQLATAHNVAVISHIRPDGDAIGSALAMGYALKDLEKDVQIIINSPIPDSLQFVEGTSSIDTQLLTEPDLIFVVDSAEPTRTGIELENYKNKLINIDHHISNTKFGFINYVDATAASTTQILTQFIPKLGLTINANIANYLLLGIITDTIGFRTENVSPDTLKTAAKLIESGANLQSLYQNALLTRSFEAVKYWGFALSKLKKMDSIVWTTLTTEDRKESGYQFNDDADLINQLSSISEAEIAIVLVEQTQQKTKISWRSKNGINVSKLANKFGGGGHIAAAGATIKLSIDKAEQLIIQDTIEYLKQHRNNIHLTAGEYNYG